MGARGLSPRDQLGRAPGLALSGRAIWEAQSGVWEGLQDEDPWDLLGVLTRPQL